MLTWFTPQPLQNKGLFQIRLALWVIKLELFLNFEFHNYISEIFKAINKFI